MTYETPIADNYFRLWSRSGIGASQDPNVKVLKPEPGLMPIPFQGTMFTESEFYSAGLFLNVGKDQKSGNSSSQEMFLYSPYALFYKIAPDA